MHKYFRFIFFCTSENFLDSLEAIGAKFVAQTGERKTVLYDLVLYIHVAQENIPEWVLEHVDTVRIECNIVGLRTW